MASDDTPPKNIKDLKGWEEALDRLKIANVQSKDSKPAQGRSDSPKPSNLGRLPSAEDLESEWKAKIKEAQKKEELLIKEPTTTKRPDSLEDVFRQLRKTEASQKKATPEALKDSERLRKIQKSVTGEAPKVRERELTGTGVPGLYKLYPMGSLPPLNIVSKLLYGISGKSIEKDIEKSRIPLYPDEYISFSVGIAFMLSIIFFVLIFILTYFNIIFALLAFVLSLLLISLFLVNVPLLKIGSGSRDVDRQLPFALRHMSSLLTAGISIFDSIVSVSKADYGALSHELDKVVWDVKSGENLSDALEDASERIGSHSFMRVTIHIRRALQMGGDVAKIISQIADDLTFEMRMKVSDFVEKLNAFAIVYLIGGIVGPVVIAVFSVVSSAKPLQSVGGAVFLDKSMLIFMILIIFPLVMAIITYLVKIMEPKV